MARHSIPDDILKDAIIQFREGERGSSPLAAEALFVFLSRIETGRLRTDVARRRLADASFVPTFLREVSEYVGADNLRQQHEFHQEMREFLLRIETTLMKSLMGQVSAREYFSQMLKDMKIQVTSLETATVDLKRQSDELGVASTEIKAAALKAVGQTSFKQAALTSLYLVPISLILAIAGNKLTNHVSLRHVAHTLTRWTPPSRQTRLDGAAYPAIKPTYDVRVHLPSLEEPLKIEAPLIRNGEPNQPHHPRHHHSKHKKLLLFAKHLGRSSKHEHQPK